MRVVFIWRRSIADASTITGRASTRLPDTLQKLFWGDADVLDDLAKQERRDVTSAVDRNCRVATVRMAELLVGAALPDLNEAKSFEGTDDVPWFQDGEAGHGSDADELRSHELRFEMWLAFFQQHIENLAQVPPQFIEGRALGVRARKTGNIANKEVRLRVPLDDGREGLHRPRNYFTANRGSIPNAG
jgi:hypothetical protein